MDGWINLIFILLSDRPFKGHRSTAWDTPPSPRAPYVMKSNTSAVANHTIPSHSLEQNETPLPPSPLSSPKNNHQTPPEKKPTPSSPCPVVLYLRKYLCKETHPVISMPSGPVLKEIFIQKKPTPSPLCPVVLYLRKAYTKETHPVTSVPSGPVLKEIPTRLHYAPGIPGPKLLVSCLRAAPWARGFWRASPERLYPFA